MSRALFVIFISLIVILSIFLGITTYDVKHLVKENEQLKKELDTLSDNNLILKLDLDKQYFIIDQVRDLHPKEVDNIIKDTE